MSTTVEVVEEAVTLEITSGAVTAAQVAVQLARFDVRDYKAACDGLTDDSAAVIAAIAACHAAGGGTVFIPGTTLVNSKLTLPNDGSATTVAPLQRSIYFEGVASHADGLNNLNHGGSRLILNYQGDGSPNDAKIVTYGSGLFSLHNITLQDTTLGPSSTPFIYSTNTTVKVDSTVAFLGSTNGVHLACAQDALVLGGSHKGDIGFNTTDSVFEGYGSQVIGAYFNNIRRPVYGRSYVNQVVIRDNFFDKGCGSNLAGGACIEIDASTHWADDPSPSAGNIISSNYFEVTYYPYGVKLINSIYNIIENNGFEDPSAGGAHNFVACVRCEAVSTGHSAGNNIKDNWTSDGYIMLSEDAGSLDLNNVSGSNTADTAKIIQNLALTKSITRSTAIGVSLTGPTQSIPYNAFTSIALNSERFDNDTMHDNSVNNTRITFHTPGPYNIVAGAVWADSAVGRRMAQILLNGTTVIGYDEQTPSAAGGATHNLGRQYLFAANDYIEFQVYQTASAGGLNVLSTALEFSAVRLV